MPSVIDIQERLKRSASPDSRQLSTSLWHKVEQNFDQPKTKEKSIHSQGSFGLLNSLNQRPLYRGDIIGAINWSKMRLEQLLNGSRQDEIAQRAIESALSKLRDLLGAPLFNQFIQLEREELNQFFAAKEPIMPAVGNALLEQVALLIRAATQQQNVSANHFKPTL